jgi:hypothetical protein
MIYTHLITFAVSAIMAFWGGVEFNQMRHDANEKQAIEQAALDKQELHRLEQARSSAALATQVMARKSEAVLRSDAAASKSELDSLRAQSTSTLRAAAGSLAACVAVSVTYDELLADLSEQYKTCSIKADEHVIDLRVQIGTP